jgi:hypothetical protein
MLGRINNDGVTSAATTAVDPVARAELALGTHTTDTELPNHAVGSAAKSQALPTELPPHIHEKAKVIGIIHHDMKDIETRAANAKELEAIRAKLLLGHKDATSGNVKSVAVGQAVAAASIVPSIALKVIGHNDNNELPPGMKKVVLPPLPSAEKSSKDPNTVGPADQQQVLGRIDDALMAVDTLLGKIDTDQLAANTRLLNLTSSVAGLNVARSTVDSTPLSLSVAMNAVDMIMTNVKSAVVSHGNISTDLVRLVLT